MNTERIWHALAVADSRSVATSRKNTHMQEVANLRGMAVGARARTLARSLARARVIGGKIRVVRFFSFSLSRQPTASHATSPLNARIARTL